MLHQLLNEQLFPLILIFSRIGSALIILPSIGEAFIGPRPRLVLALAISILVLPVLLPITPSAPDDPKLAIPMILGEVTFGLFLGAMVRILTSALAIAGTIIAFNTGFANALLLNPTSTSQSVLHGVFLSLAGLALIFATELHHVFLRAITDSYNFIPPGKFPGFEMMASHATSFLAKSFYIGLQLGMPFTLGNLVFYTLLGILGRLSPQVQVFFVALPASMLFGLFLLFTLFGIVMRQFIGRLSEEMDSFLFYLPAT